MRYIVMLVYGALAFPLIVFGFLIAMWGTGFRDGKALFNEFARYMTEGT